MSPILMTKQAAFTCLSLLLALPLVVYSDDCVQVVHLKTGDVKDASTNAGVALKLYDAQGNTVQSSDMYTDGIMGKGHNYFQRGNLDMFAFRSECLASEVCKIELSHNNQGIQPGWYVSYVKVTTSAPNAECTQKKFRVDQWLAIEYPYSLNVTGDNCTRAQLNSDSVIDMLVDLPSSN